MSTSTHDAIYAAAVANGITEGAALVAFTMGYTAVQSMVCLFVFFDVAVVVLFLFFSSRLDLYLERTRS